MAKKFKGKLIVVSNRLPYAKTADPSGKAVWERSSGGLVTALDPILKEEKGVWVGWNGLVSREDEPREVETHTLSSLGLSPKKNTYKIVSIPLNAEEVEKYYCQFSNNTLWGLFHYFFEKSSIDYSSWEVYKKVNKRFAEEISRIARPKDVIWINDFHLFLCPQYLRQINKKLRIHFFLHIPFPHVDIFSTLPWGKKILESLACCNSLGFQHRQHLRNYVGAANALCGDKVKKPYSYVNPISIDFKKFDRTSKKTRVIKRKKALIKQNHGLRMVLSVDRLDYSKGLLQKLLGIEKLLQTHPEFIGDFEFYQIAIPSREEVPAYQALKKGLDELVGRINGNFSTGTWHPIDYMYTSVPFDELIAFYSAADIALVTPLRDGMNLVCKEYVASHSDEDGVLILSKFTGASAQLKNAISVNPYSIEDISEALRASFAMPAGTRRTRMRRMRQTVRANDIKAWLEKALAVFEYTKNKEK